MKQLPQQLPNTSGLFWISLKRSALPQAHKASGTPPGVLRRSASLEEPLPLNRPKDLQHHPVSSCPVCGGPPFPVPHCAAYRDAIPEL